MIFFVNRFRGIHQAFIAGRNEMTGISNFLVVPNMADFIISNLHLLAPNQRWHDPQIITPVVFIHGSSHLRLAAVKGWERSRS